MKTFKKLTSANLPEKLRAPTSKSYANRALIIAALDPKPIILHDLPESEDVKDLIAAFKTLGLKIEQDGSRVTILNSFPECEHQQEDSIVLPGSEGGTTVRFLMALLALGHNTYQIPLKGRLAQRPFDSYLALLSSLGVKAELENEKVLIKGAISNTEQLEVDCSQTTQFASALMLIQKKANLEIKLKDIEGSSRYLAMTEKILADFELAPEYHIPVDFSCLSYIISYAVLSGDTLVENAFEQDEFQADSILVELLQKSGVDISFSDNGMLIKKMNTLYEGFDVNGAECIDLVPTLIFLASFAKNPSKFRNIKNLELKESKRLSEMQKMMTSLNIEHHYNKKADILEVDPIQIEEKKALILETAEDHRMIMVASLYLKLLGGGELYPYDNIKKSFPDFFTFFV